MGFWDTAFNVVKDVGTTIATEIEKAANNTRETKLKYEEMADDELIRLVHSDGFFGKTQKEKGIAFGILTRRGFSVEDINSRRG